MLPSRDLRMLRRYFEFASFTTNVEVFVQDMWNGYRTIQQAFFPFAINVVDKFHVVRRANLGFENARKAYQAQLTRAGRVSMKRRHRMFLSRWDNMGPERQDKVREVLREHPDLLEVYQFEEAFFDIYEAETREQAVQAYERWLNSMPWYLRRHFAALVTAMRDWQDSIFNYYDARHTNGAVENLKGRINKISSLACGMKFETLRAKALLRYGEIIDIEETRHYKLNLREPNVFENLRRQLPWWGGKWPIKRTFPSGRGFDLPTLTADLEAGHF